MNFELDRCPYGESEVLKVALCDFPEDSQGYESMSALALLWHGLYMLHGPAMAALGASTCCCHVKKWVSRSVQLPRGRACVFRLEGNVLCTFELHMSQNSTESQL